MPGLWSANVIYTYLDEFEIIDLPGADPDNEKGEIGNAKHRFTTNFRYSRDNFMVQWQLRYIDKSRLEDQILSDQDCIDPIQFVESCQDFPISSSKVTTFSTTLAFSSTHATTLFSSTADSTSLRRSFEE